MGTNEAVGDNSTLKSALIKLILRLCASVRDHLLSGLSCKRVAFLS